MSRIEEKVSDIVIDLVSTLFFYGRKYDEDLSAEQLEHAINCGEITSEYIIEVFAKEVKRVTE